MIDFFEGESADEAWRKAANRFFHLKNASWQESRQGPTLELLHSTFFVREPQQRWVLSREPSINPAFAIAEVFWILSGSNKASFLNYWNPRLPKFAGSGSEYHGAYGQRLRSSFGLDQLVRAKEALSANPNSRQVVLQIWHPELDLPKNDGSPSSADVPCNVCSMPKVRNGKLEWLQVMRSNDLFLGSPHNFVQFTTLQEVLAGWLGLEVGSYAQISDSLHCYKNDLETYGVAKDQQQAKNSDDLRLPFSDFQKVFGRSLEIMHRLCAPDLSKAELAGIEKEELLNPYKNQLLICAADSARRRGWEEEMGKLALGCSNPALKQAWRAWLGRWES